MISGVQWVPGGAVVRGRGKQLCSTDVDTLLLVSAIGLALAVHQYPFVHDWLTAKLLALVAYIVFGSIALNYGPTRSVRLGAWLAALAVFGYIVGVAVTRRVFPF